MNLSASFFFFFTFFPLLLFKLQCIFLEPWCNYAASIASQWKKHQARLGYQKAEIAWENQQHKDSYVSVESGQNKSRQFLLAVTRQNTEALYLLKCKFIQGFMLPCCKYQTPLKTIEQEWIDFPLGLHHLQILIAWHYISAKLKILHSKTIREICEVQAVYSLNYMIDFLCSYLLHLNHFSSLFNWFLSVMCCSLNNLSLVYISFISVLIYIYRPKAAETILIFFKHFSIQSLVICDECSFSFMVLKSQRGNLIRFAFIWVICPSEIHDCMACFVRQFIIYCS